MVAIGSICRSLPFIPESFWRLSTTAKLSRLSVIGFAAYGVGRWVSLRSRRVTELETKLAQTDNQLGGLQGQVRRLEGEIGALRAKLEAQASPREEIEPTLAERYAEVERSVFNDRMEALKAVLSKDSLAKLLGDAQERAVLRRAIVDVFWVLTTRLEGKTRWLGRDTPAEKLDHLSKALDRLDGCLVRAAPQLDNEAYSFVVKVVEPILTKLAPAVFKMSEKGGVIDCDMLEGIYDEICAPFPEVVVTAPPTPSANGASLWKSLKNDVKNGVRKAVAGTVLASAAAIKHTIREEAAAFKKVYDDNESRDALVDLGVVTSEILIDLIHENDETPAGKLLWDELREIVRDDSQRQVHLQNIFKFQHNRLSGENGQTEVPIKIIQACKNWYKHIFQTSDGGVSITRLVDNLKGQFEQAFPPTATS